jgi:peptide chain release factor 2
VITNLQKAATAPDLWDDPASAQQTMQTLADLESEVSLWNELRQRTADALELLALDEDDELLGDIQTEARKLERQLARLEFQLLLSGPHDRAGAILSIHAGAGGTEAQDWAEMLLRMYLRWAESRGYATEIWDLVRGTEAGTKSATVMVSGTHAYGYLKAERGVHRLVRLSPFDEAHRRHTSFALVEVVPDVGEEIEITIDPDELRIDFYRASGAGGQHVQKNSTAVRITHVPTGIVATCQNERSQVQNREMAMKILRARLYDAELQKQEEEQARLKGKHVSAGWGNQIRSYVLHPYRMVKDLRTNHETGDASAVLDGDLDPFIEAYLKDALGEN